MHFIKNMKIGSKLLSAFAIMVIFMGVIGYTGYQSVNGIQHDLEKIFSVQLPAIDYLIEADRDLQQLLVAERSMMFTDPNSAIFKQFIEEYEANFKQSDTRWSKYAALASTAAEKELFGAYQKAREAWQEDSRKVVQLAKQGNVQQATELTLGEAKTHFEEMRDQLDKLTELNLELAKRTEEDALAVAEKNRTKIENLLDRFSASQRDVLFVNDTSLYLQAGSARNLIRYFNRANTLVANGYWGEKLGQGVLSQKEHKEMQTLIDFFSNVIRL